MAYSTRVVLRGTERYHMENYLRQQGYRQESPEVFTGPGIGAAFEPDSQVSFGSIRITEVAVTFEGEEALVTAEVAHFKRHFLTAGG